MPDSDISVTPEDAQRTDFEHIIDLRSTASTTPSIEGSVYVAPASLLADPSRFLPDPNASTLIVCDIGMRSSTASRALHERGYTAVASLKGGMEAWFTAGLPVNQPGLLTSEQYRRYDRQIKLPDIGVAGQRSLGDASVVVVGIGGLGAPTLSYLAGSGVGHITVIDSGDVELSNLHRQTIYTTASIGSEKTVEAASFAAQLNPDIEIKHVTMTLDETNAEDTLRDYDVIVACTDSFETTRAITVASVHLGIPMVFGSVYRREGQLAVFDTRRGGCYACAFPMAPGAGGLDCSIVGVLGAVTGVIGAMQAAEVVKLITNPERVNVETLTLYNADDRTLESVTIRKNPECEVCS